MKNQVQLITYIDRLGGGGIKALKRILNETFHGEIKGVHLLPFYYPIDGADAGFDPIDHLLVDPGLGTWQGIQYLSHDVDIMADLIVNHVSADSDQFKDFLQKGNGSNYADFFLRYQSVFPAGATEEELMKIFRPRPGLPFTYTTLSNSEKVLLWTTFTSRQIDINVTGQMGQEYLTSILKTFTANGISMIRLDAAGYAIKKAGTSCFMIPETYDFIADLSMKANSFGIETLVEIHSHYQTQIEIAQRVDWVYDFALPPLLLHAFFFKTARYLQKWINIRPQNAVTVLDTHDGIGIVDIGPDKEKGLPGLVPDDELDQVVELIHEKSDGESRQATGAVVSNLDLYQVNCTYYRALGSQDLPYLLARTIQFFLPGIPQVYYTGLLFGENDLDLLHRTNVGRDINRHYYSEEEISHAMKKIGVQSLFRLINFRNNHPAFDGQFSASSTVESAIQMEWINGDEWARLEIDFKSMKYLLWFTQNEKIVEFDF